MVDNRRQLVIVALPSEDDPVRKFSSEKEPHLTLLYLGDPGYDSSQIDIITGYVEHAASLLYPFTLDVDSRGVLGDSQADVLFFNKKWSQNIATFRSQLLRQDLISEAYLSTDQFPEWNPHLTMGFPGTPAKKDDRDYPGFSYVRFDRIALWTGDSSGPTFQLQTHGDGLEDVASHLERGRLAASDVLQHHGIKGMHWGVRKDDSGGGKPLVKERTNTISVKLKNGETLTLQGDKTPALAKFISRMSSTIRNKVNNAQNYTLKDAKGTTVGEMSLDKESSTSMNVVWVGVKADHRGKGYASAAMKAAIGEAKRQNLSTVTLEVPGKSPDARHIYEKLGFKENPSKSEPWDPVWGGLTAMQLDLAVKHGNLQHHGIKGMKWGVRKADSSTGKGSSPQLHLSEDAKAVVKAHSKIKTGGTGSLSNQDLQRIITRMSLESQYHNLTTTAHKNEIDRGLQTTQKILKIGKTVEDVRKFLATPTGKAVKTGVSAAFTAGAAYATGGGSAAAKIGTSIVVRQAANHFTNVGN